jgi:hypothetical protein
MTEQEYQTELYELRQQQQAADEDVRRAYWAFKADPMSAALANRLDSAYYRQKAIVIRIEHLMQQWEGGA